MPASRIDLNLLRSFVAVHTRGSFSAAAEHLGVPRSTVSRAVTALEEALGTSLFQRTTRRVSTTDAGLALHERVGPTLEALETAVIDVPDRGEAPSGVLRVTATADVGRIFLTDVVARYVARYPGVDVELHASNTMVDLVKERFDVAVRLSGKAMRDSSLVARKVGVVKFEIFAAPAYLARAGTPRSGAELARHDWVSMRGIPLVELAQRAGVVVAEGNVRARSNEMLWVRELVRQGVGVAAMPSFVAASDVATGRLVRVLPGLSAEAARIYMVHPARKHLPSRLVEFREMLIETFRSRVG